MKYEENKKDTKKRGEEEGRTQLQEDNNGMKYNTREVI